MFQRIAILIATFVATALVFASTQSDIKQGLDDGKRLYDAGQYSEAIQALRGVDRRISESTPKDQAVQTKLYLGVSLFLNGRPESDAQEVFQQLCRIDPTYAMNRNGREFKQQIVDIFQKAKRTCDEEVRTQCSAKCASVTQVLSGRDPVKIQAAVETLGAQCDCNNVRATAAQTVFDIANEHFDQRDTVAQSEFQIAVRLNDSLSSRVPKFGTIRVTALEPGGQLYIDNKLVRGLGANTSAEFLQPPGSHQVSLEPANQDYEKYEGGVNVAANTTAVIELRPKLRAPVRTAPILKQTTLENSKFLDFELGSQSDTGGDFMWFNRNGNPQLVPQGKAEYALLRTNYDRVADPSGLKDLTFKNDPIRVTAVISIAIRTQKGKYVTAEISQTGTSSLLVRWVAYP